MHSQQLGECGVHQGLTPRPDQISEIEQKDRVRSSDVSLHVVDLDRPRLAKPNPPEAPKQPHAGPGGRAGVGAGSPSVRCWGGEQHCTDCQGNPFEIGQRSLPGGYGDGGGRGFSDLDRCIQVVVFVLMAIFS